MKGLTERQLQILSYIEEFLSTNHFSPSYREIQQHFGFSSIGSVVKHINTLKRKGALDYEAHCGRSIFINRNKVERRDDIELELPYIGYISATSSIEIFSHSQKLAIPQFMVNNPEITYVLRARGNSLNDEMISDGDLLLVETRTEPDEEETIVGKIKSNLTIVRKFQSEGNHIRLKSQNPRIPPIILNYEDLDIHGVLTSVLRLYF